MLEETIKLFDSGYISGLSDYGLAPSNNMPRDAYSSTQPGSC